MSQQALNSILIGTLIGFATGYLPFRWWVNTGIGAAIIVLLGALDWAVQS